jgi:hypothetical protein
MGKRRGENEMSKQATAAPGKYFAKDFFAYIIGPFGSLAPAAQLPGNVTLDADSDFLWQKFNVFAMIGDAGETEATQVLPAVTITIKDTASGRDLMNAPVPVSLLAGDGQLPFILPTPKVFQARGTIAVNVQNISTDDTYTNLYLCFIGTKLFLS